MRDGDDPGGRLPDGGFDDDPFDDGGFDDDGFDDLVISDTTPPQMHGGIPISGYHDGEPVPDLRRLPKVRWPDVLRPLRPGTRAVAKNGVATQADVIAAERVVGELILDDIGAGTLAHAQPPRMPVVAVPARAPSRQVHVRLAADEHARLVEAARLFGMRATALARALTILRGVDRALYDGGRERRLRDKPRR